MTETDLRRQVAQMVEREQKKLMSEMRRRTTLTDQQILDILEPFSSATFGAGYKMGWRDAEVDTEVTRTRVFFWKAAAMVSSAAIVAWWLTTTFAGPS